MIAGHLFLDKNQNDLYNKSGIYSLYEHFSNTNNIRQKKFTYIYDSFKTGLLNKYSYSFSTSVEVFNNESGSLPVVGVNPNFNYGFLQFTIYPTTNTIISFLFYNKNQTLPQLQDLAPIEYYLNTFYSITINNQKIENLINLYSSLSQQSSLFNYSKLDLQLNPSSLSSFFTIKIEFFDKYQNANLALISTTKTN